jgi:hypothetical protein
MIEKISFVYDQSHRFFAGRRLALWLLAPALVKATPQNGLFTVAN